MGVGFPFSYGTVLCISVLYKFNAKVSYGSAIVSFCCVSASSRSLMGRKGSGVEGLLHMFIVGVNLGQWLVYYKCFSLFSCVINYSFHAVAVVEWLGMNEATLTISGVALAFGSYLVSVRMLLLHSSIVYMKVIWIFMTIFSIFLAMKS